MGYRRRHRYYRRRNDDGAEALAILFILPFVILYYLGKLAFQFGGWLYDNKGNLKNTFKLNTSYRPTDNPTSAFSQEVSTVTNHVQEPNILQDESTSIALPIMPVAARYTLRPTLITNAEQKFLDVLAKVVDGQYIIENQVPLSRIVIPKDSNRNYVNYRDFNQIKAKSVDFVLYDKTYRPILCIELDDNSHFRLDRIKRDLFVDEVMSSVGLRILHIRASYSYDLEKLREQIFLNK